MKPWFGGVDELERESFYYSYGCWFFFFFLSQFTFKRMGLRNKAEEERKRVEEEEKEVNLQECRAPWQD